MTYHLLKPIPAGGTLCIDEHPNMREEDEWWVIHTENRVYRNERVNRTYLVGPFETRMQARAALAWAYDVRDAHQALVR